MIEGSQARDRNGGRKSTATTTTTETTEVAASGHRLDAVREILKGLETATRAGQQHLMMKVVGLLRREAPARDHWVGDQQWNKIAAALEALTQEASRLAPDAGVFARQAGLVADALAAR